MPDLEIMQEYVKNLSSLLASSSIVEQRDLLKSFVKEIRVPLFGVLTNMQKGVKAESNL